MARINSQDRINDRLSPGKNKKGGKGLLLGGLTTLAVVAITIVSVSAFTSSNNEPLSGEPNRIVTPDNIEEIIESMEDKKVTAGSYNVRMNPTWTFKNGKAASEDAYVENAVTNNNDVRVTITLNDTEELIYTSPIIPLGSRLADIVLDKDLPAGSYDCIITYHLLDDKGEDVSTVNLNLGVVINN